MNLLSTKLAVGLLLLARLLAALTTFADVISLLCVLHPFNLR